MMNNILEYGKGFVLAAVIVLAIVVWKSFPFGELYVSDIEDWEVVSWNWSEPQRNVTINGQSLIINEILYEKGIGAHAPTVLKVLTPPGYTHFVADVGVSDEVLNEAPSSIQFRVWGDGVILYETPVIGADSPAYRIDVNIQWTGELLLEATDAGDGANSDHAIWGNARFISR
ncbi:MAG: NPCBM/NEW2 domain-containing protein [Candidatus Hinthialibacter sp.]